MISSIQLQNYRSYEIASFEFDKGVNIVIGPNASGKTNLLEALILIGTGKNFRGKDENVISNNHEWTKVVAYFDESEKILKIERKDGRILKTYEIDSKKYSRLPVRLQSPIVVFEPNHLSLLHGSPETRRDYIDKVISQQTLGYSALINLYKRTLAQRNSLLKTGKIADSLFVWDIKLVEIGAQIAEHRKKYIEKSNQQLSKIYSELADKPSSLNISYVTDCRGQYAGTMHKLLEGKRQMDTERGFTSVGPHRDDIKIHLNGKLSTTSASRGEVRTILLSMKIIELKGVEESLGAQPVFMLDDVFSELDGARRRALTEYMNQYQTFITTTDADVVLHNFSQNTKQILI